MSSDVSSVYPCLQVSLCALSFIHPSVTQNSLPFLSLLSRSPTHFTQNTFLSFIFPFHLASYSSHCSFFPPPSLSVFWTFLLVPSVSLLPSPPLSPVMNESVGWVQFIFTEQGSNALSVSLALHISIPTLKRQTEPEVRMG